MEKKKYLILQMRPEDETADSEFDAILRVAEINKSEVHRIRVETIEKFNLDLNKYCAIIAGGSPFDVSCPPNKKSTVQRQVEAFYDDLFDQVFEKDFPFLGVCSGNGLLGQYCNTPISGKHSEPISSVTVYLTEDGKKDDLVFGLPNDFLAFVGHKEACDTVPNGAVLLASSKQCPVQMFRIKNNIYATQFHPEADVAEFILRINIYKNHGYFEPNTADELIESIIGKETPHTAKILKRFAKKYHPNDA